MSRPAGPALEVVYSVPTAVVVSGYDHSNLLVLCPVYVVCLCSLCSSWVVFSSAVVDFCSTVEILGPICSTVVVLCSALVGVCLVCSALESFSLVCSALESFSLVCSALEGPCSVCAALVGPCSVCTALEGPCSGCAALGDSCFGCACIGWLLGMHQSQGGYSLDLDLDLALRPSPCSSSAPPPSWIVMLASGSRSLGRGYVMIRPRTFHSSATRGRSHSTWTLHYTPNYIPQPALHLLITLSHTHTCSSSTFTPAPHLRT